MLPLSLPLPLSFPLPQIAYFYIFPMRKKFWPPFRVQDAAEKADVSWQRCREGSCPFMGLMRVNYSLTESEKKISEAWSLPRVYTSLQNLRSQLSSKPAVLQCQSREERQKAFFVLEVHWWGLNQILMLVFCWKSGLRTVCLAQKKAQCLGVTNECFNIA